MGRNTNNSGYYTFCGNNLKIRVLILVKGGLKDVEKEVKEEMDDSGKGDKSKS